MLLRSDRFVGRARELRVLDAALTAAIDGRGSIVLVAGEPGIGKTRTAGELARRARDAGAEVLVGRCFEGEGAPAFWPWVQMLRGFAESRDPAALAGALGSAASDVAAVVPELRERLPDLPPAPVLDPEPARFRFFDGVTQMLTRAAAARPIVLLVDDLHGADKPSLLLLQFLARSLRNARVLVVGGLRDFALAREHPLADTVGELVREQVVGLIRLDGLDQHETAELIGEVANEAPAPALAAAVWSRSEGNPLYTLEVARTLVSSGGFDAAVMRGRVELPETVRLAIARRIRGLTPDCQRTLALAALFGREFQVEALSLASGMELRRVLELLDEAARARIVESSPREARQRHFTHALFGETLAHDLGDAARAVTHRRLAEVLAADPSCEELSAEIAHHWLEAGAAGDPDEAVRWSSRAARRALDRLAYEEAARLFGKALQALEASSDSSDARRAELLLGRGEAHQRAAEVLQAKRAFLEAAAIGRRLSSRELLTRAALGYAPAMVFAERLGPDSEVIALLEEAVDAWQGRESGLCACVMARLSLALFFADRKRATALGNAALAIARRIGDPATLRYVLARWLANSLIPSQPEERLAAATELVRLAENARDLEALAVGRLWRAIHSLEVGDATAMRREQALLASLAEELHQPIWSWYARATDGMRAMLDGRFADAELAIEAALEVGKTTLPWAASAHSVFSKMVLRILQGRAGEFATEYRALVPGHPVRREAMAPLAWAQSELHDPVEARSLLELVTADDFAYVAKDALIVMSFLSEVCAYVGDEQRAARLYEWMASLVSGRTRWVVFSDAAPTIGPAAHHLGLLARTMGQLARAAAHFEDAIRAAASAGSPTFLARAQYEYAVLLGMRAAPGDAARSAKLLAEARATASAIGMAGLVAKIDSLDAPPIATPEASAQSIFRRDGDFWTIAYAGKEIRLRDLRGLHYLATLLREPGREFHATDLVRSGRGPTFAPPIDDAIAVTRGTGDAGEPLDARARAAYKARLAELDDAIAEAERLNDRGRLERAREERAALLAELGAAARGKRASSDAERARLTATKGTKAALERIAANHPELGAHLHATVRRGYFCAYVPDPRHPIEWET